MNYKSKSWEKFIFCLLSILKECPVHVINFIFMNEISLNLCLCFYVDWDGFSKILTYIRTRMRRWLWNCCSLITYASLEKAIRLNQIHVNCSTFRLYTYPLGNDDIIFRSKLKVAHLITLWRILTVKWRYRG